MSGICAFTRDRKRVFAHPRRLRGRCHPLAPHFCAVPRAVTPINGRSVRVHHFQSGHPQQIVSSSYKVAPRLCSFSTPIPGASQPTHRLHPSKDFLYPLADLQTDLVTLLTRSAMVQARHLDTILAPHVWADLLLATTLDKDSLVIVFVRAHRLDAHALVKFLMGVDLLQGYRRLGLTDRVVQRELRTQTVSVVHQYVPAEAQLGFFAVGLSIQHALRIRRALVSVVAPFFPAEVHRGIAWILVFCAPDLLGIGAVFADEAFHTGPRLDQRAVRREVFITGPAFLTGEVIHFGEEKSGHVGGENPLVVLGEDAVVEATFAELPVEKPQPEQIVAQLFTKESFAAHTIESSEHAGLEQLLRRNTRRTILCVEIIEEGRKLFKNRVHSALDGAQRMVGWHALVQVDDRQEVRLSLRFSTHDFQTLLSSACSIPMRLFQQPANLESRKKEFLAMNFTDSTDETKCPLSPVGGQLSVVHGPVVPLPSGFCRPDRRDAMSYSDFRTLTSDV